MSKVLITGAGGFVGGAAVRVLHAAGHQVVAGVRRPTEAFEALEGVETVALDLCNAEEVDAALTGVRALLHFAAVADPAVPIGRLREVNVEGTRRLWQAADRHGVHNAVYCSTVAVYGLLGRNSAPLDERAPARAVEAYGRTKLEGERVALEVVRLGGPRTVILRPAAIFGPGERSRLGAQLRRAAFSRIVLPGLLRDRAFSFVHVDDVARAAAHLLEVDPAPGEIFNLAVTPAVTFEAAAEAYTRVLRGLEGARWRARAVARVSAVARRIPGLPAAAEWLGAGKLFFPVGRQGFDITYSGQKVAKTGFAYRWQDFEGVLRSCLDGREAAP